MSAAPTRRTPAAREKLAAAEATLAGLEADVGSLALEASEGKAGAEKALAAHRARIDQAARNVDELRRAVGLAERLDREADAAGAAKMRAEQLGQFKLAMKAREEAMAAVLAAGSAMAAAYGEYSEATLRAQIAVPTGTAVPQMGIGPNALYGPAFGPCERLILAELYRLAPARADGIGRFVLPFAKPISEMLRNQPDAIAPGIGELRAANQAIMQEIEAQVSALADREMTAAAGDRKEAA
jgi:hypothetical protein